MVSQSHLVIVDGHHLLYRAYWAIPRTMKTNSGEQVNTVFGVASMLLQILKVEEPSHLLFCFDAGDETFRHALYDAYKSGRAETPDDFYAQIPRALELIDRFQIKSVSGKQHEADDYACAYARAATAQGFRVTIVSGDRDLLQLVDGAIRVSIPHKGYQAAEYLGPKEVEARYGVLPSQIAAYKGLVGDSSDNLPGVKGIGPKAAAALLQKYGSLQSIYDHLAEIRESWRSKLIADRAQAFFCERMATLICDVPLSHSIDQLAFDGIRASPIVDFCTKLEFSLVLKRFLALLATTYGTTHFLRDDALFKEGHRSPSHARKALTDEQLVLL